MVSQLSYFINKGDALDIQDAIVGAAMAIQDTKTGNGVSIDVSVLKHPLEIILEIRTLLFDVFETSK